MAQSPDQNSTPKYYATSSCALWFQLTTLERPDDALVSKLRLYNTPSLRPANTGMRGLIYVTIADESQPENKALNRSTQRRGQKAARADWLDSLAEFDK